jgi:hypothetical protein
MALAAEQTDAESKLRELFEHFTNVFPKKALWEERDFKAGAKYGLTTIKPFLAGEASAAQILPMTYQQNPVLSVKKYAKDEAIDAGAKLVKDLYGPTLKKCLDVVYGVRRGLAFSSDSHGAKAIAHFEDAGVPMRAELTISVWSENSDTSPLAVYVNIIKQRKS